jgi:hypothetical protein
MRRRRTISSEQRMHRVYMLWMTSAADGANHAVTEACVAHGRASGVYLACCRHRVLPDSLLTPPGPRCSVCARMTGIDCR